ncbi:MAG TPA: ribosome biogenesis GTP-binding protein YihA/YsxC [Polyangiaceae bacterium]|jgi:GTP-binding protein
MPTVRPADTRSREAPPRVRSAEHVASASALEHLPAPTSLEVAFAGRSNVGKSSLLNRLLGRKKLARTSSTPGCTRQLNCYRVETTRDERWVFVDLPGYGYAKRSKQEIAEWATLIEAYLSTRPGLALLVLLVDVRRGVGVEEQQLIDWMRRDAKTRVPALVVATKIDKLPRSRRSLALAKVGLHGSRPPIGFSAVDGSGEAELWSALRATLAGEQAG